MVLLLVTTIPAAPPSFRYGIVCRRVFLCIGCCETILIFIGVLIGIFRFLLLGHIYYLFQVERQIDFGHNI